LTYGRGVVKEGNGAKNQNGVVRERLRIKKIPLLITSIEGGVRGDGRVEIEKV